MEKERMEGEGEWRGMKERREGETYREGDEAMLFLRHTNLFFFPFLMVLLSFPFLSFPFLPQIPADVVHRKETLYLTMLDRVTPVASVVAHVRAMHGKIPLAIVSGSPRNSIIRTLTILGLLDFFDTLVGSEDYAHGKPHPEPFLTAAQRCVPPSLASSPLLHLSFFSLF